MTETTIPTGTEIIYQGDGHGYNEAVMDLAAELMHLPVSIRDIIIAKFIMDNDVIITNQLGYRIHYRRSGRFYEGPFVKDYLGRLFED